MFLLLGILVTPCQVCLTHWALASGQVLLAFLIFCGPSVAVMNFVCFAIGFSLG